MAGADLAESIGTTLLRPAFRYCQMLIVASVRIR